MNKQNKLFSRLLIALSLSGVALVSATAGAILAVSFYENKPLQQVELTPEQEQIFNGEETVSLTTQLNRPVNIIVLGVKVLTSDLKEPPAVEPGYHALVNSFDGLSDTILLLRFEPQQKKLIVLSIPRDTKTDIAGYGVNKINAANDYGGPALTAQTISDLLGGVPIDRYVRINVQGVEELIDAIGGVTVDVPKDMKYTDHSQHLYIDLKKGTQHLDGAKALQFLRFRYDIYGDIGRVQRQQILMRAILEKAINPKLLFKSPEIFGIIQSHIDTNLTVEELVALSTFATKTKRNNIQMLMLPGDFSGNGKEQISYWLPDYDKIETMMAEHFQLGYHEAEYNTPDDVKVAIQDSTGDPQAVQQMILKLKQAGYQHVYVTQDWQQSLAVTRIIAQSGDDVSAIALRATLGTGEILVESTGALGSDVTIVLGEDWREQYQQNIEQKQLVSY